LQVKLCDPCLSALKWFVYHARRYTSALLYLYLTHTKHTYIHLETVTHYEPRKFPEFFRQGVAGMF